MNDGIPSALVASGSVAISSLDETLTFDGTIGGEVELPLVGTPCALDLYLKIDAEASLAISYEVDLSNLDVSFIGGIWDGAPQVPGSGSVGTSLSVTCDGSPLTSANESDCITTKLTGTLSGSVSDSLWLQAGPDAFNIGIGPSVTDSYSTEAGLAACASFGWEANLDIPPFVTVTEGQTLFGPYPNTPACNS